MGHTPFPPKVHTKHQKKKQHHFSINNAAELAQFKDLKKEKNEVNILTLSVHHPEGVDPITNYSIPMVVRRGEMIKRKTMAKEELLRNG